MLKNSITLRSVRNNMCIHYFSLESWTPDPRSSEDPKLNPRSKESCTHNILSKQEPIFKRLWKIEQKVKRQAREKNSAHKKICVSNLLVVRKLQASCQSISKHRIPIVLYNPQRFQFKNAYGQLLCEDEYPTQLDWYCAEYPFLFHVFYALQYSFTDFIEELFSWFFLLQMYSFLRFFKPFTWLRLSIFENIPCRHVFSLLIDVGKKTLSAPWPFTNNFTWYCKSYRPTVYNVLSTTKILTFVCRSHQTSFRMLLHHPFSVYGAYWTLLRVWEDSVNSNVLSFFVKFCGLRYVHRIFQFRPSNYCSSCVSSIFSFHVWWSTSEKSWEALHIRQRICAE